MENNFVDLNLIDYIESILKDINTIEKSITDIRDDIQQIKHLCSQLNEYNNSLVDFKDFIYDFNDSSLNQMYCWLIDGYSELNEVIKNFDSEIRAINNDCFNIKSDANNLYNISENTLKYVDKLEGLFGTSGNISFSDSGYQDTNSVVQNDVLKSIDSQIQANRNLNQQFSDEVYRGVYEKIIQITPDEMEKSHGSR